MHQPQRLCSPEPERPAFAHKATGASVDSGGKANFHSEPAAGRLHLNVFQLIDGDRRQSHHFRCDVSRLVYDLKEDIEQRLAMPYKTQELRFEDKVMTNGRKLRYYGVEPEMKIGLICLESGALRNTDFQIFVKTLDGQNISIRSFGQEEVEI